MAVACRTLASFCFHQKARVFPVGWMVLQQKRWHALRATFFAKFREEFPLLGSAMVLHQLLQTRLRQDQLPTYFDEVIVAGHFWIRA